MFRYLVFRNFIPGTSIAILIVAAFYSLVVPPPQTNTLDNFLGERVILEGEIVKDPDIRDKTIRLTVKPESINGTLVYQSDSKVMVSVDRFQGVSYGDFIEVSGTLREPEPFETDTGRVFNYPKYLEAHGITHVMPFSDIEVIKKSKGNVVVSTLLSIKHFLIRGIEKALPEPYAALSSGLLLGEKQSLGDELTEDFRKAGVVHIIVLSGYNVALVINAVLLVSLKVFPRLLGYGLAALFVLGFAILTGGAETTIRATIMALFMMIARVLNRPALALRSLFVAAAIMAVWNPFVVLYDLSFQLSVAATFGLIVFSDRIARYLSFVTERFGLREIVSTTLATQITVLPLLVFSIGAVSLMFLPANALILPVVPLTMLLSFIASLVALLAPYILLPFSTLAYLPLLYIIEVSKFFGNMPFASVEIPTAATGAVLGIVLAVYAGVFVFFSLKNVKKSPRR